MSLSTGRVSLDVGGTNFVAAVSTLTTNSAYFASLLSENWSKDGASDIFLDQDPLAFGIILAYMRRGMIRVEDINVNVVALAEFLGTEKLLVAIKVRWYNNIGKGPVHSDEEQIAREFDHRYGGVHGAISSGLFPLFLERDDINAEKDLAVVSAAQVGDDINNMTFSVDLFVNGKQIPTKICNSLVGALNGVFANGYTMHEVQMDRHNDYWSEVTFSRRRHSAIKNKAINVFIPSEGETKRDGESKLVIQLAMMCQEQEMACDRMYVPADCSEHASEEERSDDPYATVFVENAADCWLQKHGFVTREEWLEKIFSNYFKLLLKEDYIDCRIYSRKIQLPC